MNRNGCAPCKAALFRGEADIIRQARPAELVKNDPNESGIEDTDVRQQRKSDCARGHILQLLRYLPDGSLCTTSVEQIFPRDSVQRNCFEFALYHDCISNRTGSGIRRDADVVTLRSVRSQRCRCEIARSSC
jgi:hypothetical protein